MKLITLIESWLDEYPISKVAETLGLEYAGHGRWKDKHTGKIVAKTINGTIRSIEGTGDNTVISPADYPNDSTAQPIAGDSIEGHTAQPDSKNDAQMDMKIPISHIQRAHTVY
jgi:hypothetical protein